MMITEQIVGTLLELKSWNKLNITQTMALDAGLLDSQENLVVVAPTAFGKNWCCPTRHVTDTSGGRVVYLVPMKPLISQKERDFEVFSKKIAGAKSSPSNWDGAGCQTKALV